MKNLLSRNSVSVKIKRNLCDARTGHVIVAGDFSKNLIFDVGLTALANGSAQGFSGFFQTCKIGSGSTSNSTYNASITFTQSGTTITASGSFFTPGMVGQLFKYGTGTGGAEYYITGYTNSTSVTVTTSATVSSPSAGTVWAVNQNSLQSFLYLSSTYQTTGGSNGNNISTNQFEQYRTFNFAVQASPYTVNEIGYTNNTTNDGTVYGRIVLASSDVVPPTQFYQVVIQVTYTCSPGSPTSVGNVATGFNSAGTAMQQNWECTYTNADGTVGGINLGQNSQDGSSTGFLFGTAAAPTLNSSPSASGITTSTGYSLAAANFSSSAQPVGVAVSYFTFSFSTSSQAVNFLAIGAPNIPFICNLGLVLNITTPFTLPATTTGTATVTRQFTRTLTNL